MRRRVSLLFALVLPGFLLILPGCSVKKLAMNAVADALSSGTTSVFATDEDLELVGDALPFALKLMESVHGSVPEHVGMHLALASGFTQYGVVYIEFPAEQLKDNDYDEYERQLTRARKMYLRANSYALSGLELLHPGFKERIFTDTEALMTEMEPEHVPFLYWGAASWMSAVGTTFEDPELIGLFPIATDMMLRAYELDPDWDNGAIHEVMISLAPNLPGPDGEARSREHFARAVELQSGSKAGPYVSLATSISVDNQDRAEFEELLAKALAVDLDAAPNSRLANEYAQAKARLLLTKIDDLFID